LASAGPAWLKFSVGYIYDKFNPYTYYTSVPTGVLVSGTPVATDPTLNTGPINEVTFGANAKYGHWSIAGTVRRDMYLHEVDYYGATLTYEDECFVFSTNYFRRNTSLDGDNGATIFYFQIGLKTLGSFNINAL